jgi:hypothetical protein
MNTTPDAYLPAFSIFAFIQENERVRREVGKVMAS